jgi:manganese/iron transport system substrate-binding protein
MKVNTHLVALLMGLAIAGCTPSTPEISTDKPNVVSTSTIIADLTETIGGDEINHKGILEPGADPHVYEPVPADSIAFEEADLILYNGYHLEPNLIKLMEATGQNARKVAVGEYITPLKNESDGQIVPDPHVWGSAQNGVIMVNAIRDALIEISPEDEAIFTANAAQLTADLERLHNWIKAQIATIPPEKRQLITTHDAFNYYTQAYGLEMAGTLIGISTEEQPSAQTVKALADQIKARNVPAIFAETTINPQLITAVAKEANVKLASQELYSDSIGAPASEGDSYIKMLIANTKAIVEALGGNYEPLR